MSINLLPKELIIEEITKYLNAKDCYQLALTNKSYLSILTNKPLWQRQVLKKILIDPNEFIEVIDNIQTYNDYKQIPQVYSEIKEIKSSVCIYVYSRGEHAPWVDMLSGVVPGYNYGTDCLRKVMHMGRFDTPYVSSKNTEHYGIPEYLYRKNCEGGDFIYTIDRTNGNKITKFGTIWRYSDHIFIVKI